MFHLTEEHLAVQEAARSFAQNELKPGVIERDIRTIIPQAEQDNERIPISAHFFAGALFAIIKWWLDNDMPVPPEAMAHLSDRLCTHGAVDVLGQWSQTEAAVTSA